MFSYVCFLPIATRLIRLVNSGVARRAALVLSVLVLPRLASAMGTPCVWSRQCAGRCRKLQCEDAADGKRCLLHADCRSSFCDWNFKCRTKHNDGHDMGWPNADYRPCKSGYGKCGYCGRKGDRQRDGRRCSSDDDCISGVCGKDGHLTAVCTGKCRSKLNNGDKCDKDVNCKSGYCATLGTVDNKGLLWPWEAREILVRRCEKLHDLHYFTGVNGLGHSNSGACKSKSGTCGYCTRKGQDYQNRVGDKCDQHKHCASRACFPDSNGDLLLCSGKCDTKKNDGYEIGLGFFDIDYKAYCKSGRGVCGTCQASRRNPEGGRCGVTSECQDGLFCGRRNSLQVTTAIGRACGGVCRPKVQDGEECDTWLFDGGNLHEGESESCANPGSVCRVSGSFKTGKFLKQFAICVPKDGGRDGHKCLVDSECHKDYWCEDGHVVNNAGRCSRCPSWCGTNGFARGCNVCANKPENMQCGERTWSEETKCFFQSLPSFYADAYAAFLTCVGTLGFAGVHNRDDPTPAPGTGALGFLGDQDLFELGRKCVAGKGDCDIELFHEQEFQVDGQIDRVVDVLGGNLESTPPRIDVYVNGRRRLIEESRADVVHAPAVNPNDKIFVETTAARSFGFGSRRRLQDENEDFLDGADIDVFGGKTIDEIVGEVPESERERTRKDIENYADTRKELLRAPTVMESSGYDGDVDVENSFIVSIDPDLVYNPKKRTVRGTMLTKGRLSGNIKFNGEALDGSLAIVQPLLAPIVLKSEFVYIGPVPMYFEIFFQPVVEIRAKMDFLVKAELDLEGDFSMLADIDVDLARPGSDKIRVKTKDSTNNVKITPKNVDRDGIDMDLEVRIVPRDVFIFFFTAGIQVDTAIGFSAKLQMDLHQPVQAVPVYADIWKRLEEAEKNKYAVVEPFRDCVKLNFQLTETFIGVRFVLTITGGDIGRIVHGACIAAASALFGRISITNVLDCANKAFFKRSAREELFGICDELNLLPDVVDLSEFDNWDLGFHKAKIGGPGPALEFDVCEGQ